MITNFDLATDEELLTQLLNHEYSRLVDLKVRCSETGYTTVAVRVSPVREPIIRKRTRALRRFVLYKGTSPKLNELMANPEFRLIKQYDFMTEQGMIVVVDFELEKGRDDG